MITTCRAVNPYSMAGPDRLATQIAAILLVAVATMGGLKLLDAAAGSHSDIDTYLFAAKLPIGDVRPSRVAPNAALCFVLISLALLVMPLRSRGAAIAAQVLALATSLVSIFAVVGYLYGVGAFYSVPAFFPMAVHTALGFLCLAAFVFIRTARRGLVAPISDPGPAGRTSRALLPAAIIIPVGCGWLRQLGEHAGLYTPEIGVALMVMVSVLTLTVLIWWNAGLLLTADARRRTAEAELARMATHDFLTGLPNRGHFMDRLMARMATPRRRADDSFAIIYMDLDGFKRVNDHFGHAAGDQLLATSPPGCARPAAVPTTLWRGSAATSSPCCWITSVPPRRPRAWRNVSLTKCRRGSAPARTRSPSA